MTDSISIGGSLFGAIKFGSGTAIQLSGKFAGAGGIGFYWNGALAYSATYADSWTGISPWLQKTPHSLSIGGHIHSEGTRSVPIGFSAGASCRENEFNPLKSAMGLSQITSTSFDLANEEYEIY